MIPNLLGLWVGSVPTHAMCIGAQGPAPDKRNPPPRPALPARWADLAAHHERPVGAYDA
jgi:hypothetical protein